MSDEKRDRNAARMRHLYGSLQVADRAFSQEAAHAFKGDEPFCRTCGRGPTHPWHHDGEGPGGDQAPDNGSGRSEE